jgi:hypothetical protein
MESEEKESQLLIKKESSAQLLEKNLIFQKLLTKEVQLVTTFEVMMSLITRLGNHNDSLKEKRFED